jgi:hypothetical protein
MVETYDPLAIGLELLGNGNRSIHAHDLNQMVCGPEADANGDIAEIGCGSGR